MTDAELVHRTWRLLQPGDIDLNGLIVHTGFDGSQETRMHQATIEIGDVIADHAGYDPAETYVESGNDDPDFSSNQHQGLTLDDGTFVWECQQLLRDGSFDVVFYYEAGAHHAVVEAGLSGQRRPWRPRRVDAPGADSRGGAVAPWPVFSGDELTERDAYFAVGPTSRSDPAVARLP